MALRVNYEGYEALNIAEYSALRAYFEYNDTTSLRELIEGTHSGNIEFGFTQTDSFKRFVADMVEGKVRRKKGKKPSTFGRGNMCFEILRLHIEHGIPIKSTATKDGACRVVGRQYRVSEETTLRTYFRFLRQLKKDWSEAGRLVTIIR